jgi:hypothetical protein
MLTRGVIRSKNPVPREETRTSVRGLEVSSGCPEVTHSHFHGTRDGTDESVLLLVMYIDVNYSFVPSTPIERVSWGKMKTLHR